MTPRENQVLEIVIKLTEQLNRPPYMQEVATVIGVTRERVRQLCNKLRAKGFLEPHEKEPVLIGGQNKQHKREEYVLNLIKLLTNPTPPTRAELISHSNLSPGATSAVVTSLVDKELLHKNSYWLVPTTERKYTREDHFWTRCDRSGGPTACWPWQEYIQPTGYGVVSWYGLQGGNEYAHRVAYMIANKDTLPKKSSDIVVRHKCDNPACCNPDHLELGTQQENVNDRQSRSNWTCRRKLTPEQVKLCREQAAMGKSAVAILKDNNLPCSYVAVLRLLQGKTYREVA